MRTQGIILAIPFAALCIGIDLLVLRGQELPWGFLTVAALLLTVLLVATVPGRRYANLRYAMDDSTLRVVRGVMFRTDTIVPFVRVQHIDVGQGPIERLAKVAHLVVHTAGTHNSIVTLPGLSREDAMAMRDAMRSHIQSDFA